MEETGRLGVDIFVDNGGDYDADISAYFLAKKNVPQYKGVISP